MLTKMKQHGAALCSSRLYGRGPERVDACNQLQQHAREVCRFWSVQPVNYTVSLIQCAGDRHRRADLSMCCMLISSAIAFEPSMDDPFGRAVVKVPCACAKAAVRMSKIALASALCWPGQKKKVPTNLVGYT